MLIKDEQAAAQLINRYTGPAVYKAVYNSMTYFSYNLYYIFSRALWV